MALLSFLGGKKNKGQNRQQKKADRRAFKLEKKKLRLENKIDRRDSREDKVATRQSGRTDRTYERQTGRTNRTDSRQAGQTNRTQIRQEGKTVRRISQDQADMVAYENGMMPIDRTANAIGAAGGLAQGLGGLATGLGAAGVFGGNNDDDTPFPRPRQNVGGPRDYFDDFEPGPPPPQAGPLGIPIMGWIAAAIAAIFLLGKKRKNVSY